MGKKLRIVNIALPVIATFSLAIVPLSVWGASMAYFVNHFKAIYNADEITLSNPDIVLHEDYHTTVTTTNKDEEIAKLNVYIGATPLDPEYDYTFNSENGDLTIYGEQITDRSLIIVTNNVKRGRFKFDKNASTTKVAHYQDSICFNFAFDGQIPPLDNSVTASLISQTTTITGTGETDKVWLELESEVVDFDQGAWCINIYFTFEWIDPSEDPIPDSQTTAIQLILSYNSGVTGVEEDVLFTTEKDGLTAILDSQTP